MQEGVVEIRRFMPGDEAALFRVYFTAIHETASRDYTQEQLAAWAPADFPQDRWAGLVQKSRPFVAVHGSEIVGYADLQPDGCIGHFFVSGSWARQGVGTRLMARLHDEATCLGLAVLHADVSLTAEPFFLRHGFQVVERRAPVRRGVALQNASMRKVLGGKPQPTAGKGSVR